MTPDPAPTPRRIWPWLILAAAGATLAVIAVMPASDPAAGLDFRFNPPSGTSRAKWLLDNPANATITEPRPVTVQVERQNNATTLRFTAKYNDLFPPNVPRGPIHRVAASDTVTLCPDHTLRILAFVVRERTRDRQAPDRIFDPAGKPMDEAVFRSQSGLTGSDVIGSGSAYQVTVVVQSSHTIAITTNELFPQNRPEWQCSTTNRYSLPERLPGMPEIHVIRTTPTYTPDGKLELLLQVYGGPIDKVPIPAKDGEQLTTPYGSIRRLVTLGEKLLNPKWEYANDKKLRYTSSGKAAGQTTLFAVSDALADHTAFTRGIAPQKRWTGDGTIWTQFADNPAQAEEPVEVFSRAATIRFTLPASLPCPDFRRWDPMDDPVPVDVDPNYPIEDHLATACGIFSNSDAIPTSLKEVPGAKTNRDLLRHLYRKAHAQGLTVQWEPDNYRSLQFIPTPTLKERARDFTEKHLPWVYDWLP